MRAIAKTATIEFNAPGGKIKIEGSNHHTWKTVRIGKIRADGLIDEVFASEGPVKPDPFLQGYDWAKGIADAMAAPTP